MIPQRSRHIALLLMWLLGSIGGVMLLGLAACAVGPVSDAQIDWVDVIQFHGITYLATTGMLGRAPVDSDLGPVFATVKFKVADNVHDPNYHFNDGDAAFLDAGTPVYSVRGYAPSFRLAARSAGRLTFYEADTNPHAKTGCDLLDIGGKVRSIGIYNDTTQFGAVTDPAQVASLVTMVLDAQVNQRYQERDSATYSIAFQLQDGTVVTRSYWIGSGELERGILLPPAFGDAIRQAVGTPSGG